LARTGFSTAWPPNFRIVGTSADNLDADLDLNGVNDENGGPILVCRGLRRPWAQIWDTEVRHTG